MDIFSEGISGTASMTKSTSERESIDVVGLRSDRILSDCSCVMRSFATSLASSLSEQRVSLLKLGWMVEFQPANLRPLSIEA